MPSTSDGIILWFYIHLDYFLICIGNNVGILIKIAPNLQITFHYKKLNAMLSLCIVFLYSRPLHIYLLILFLSVFFLAEPQWFALYKIMKLVNSIYFICSYFFSHFWFCLNSFHWPCKYHELGENDTPVPDLIG